MPIGPVNVAVIDAAYRHTLRRAIAVGLGGAIADALYAALGVLGVTPVLSTYPSIPPILYAVSGVVLLVYGFLTARSQPVAPAVAAPSEPHAVAASSVAKRREMWRASRVGARADRAQPGGDRDVGRDHGLDHSRRRQQLEGLACAVGVFVGSFGWFSLVAYLTHKGKHVLGDKAAWIPRVVGIALMVYAVYLLAKAVKFVVA